MIDKFIRYGEVKEFLESNPKGTILEIGPGPLGLGACLPYRFVGVDPWYPEPPIETQQAVKGSALELPFPDESFDYVLCIEVLEHLPPELRSKVVSEMCRVAKRAVMITHPYGTLARWGDRCLGFRYDILKLFGKGRPWWLVEHMQNPYPDPELYLHDISPSFTRKIQRRENVFLHVEMVFFSHLKIISRRLKKLHEKNPNAVNTMVKAFNFPPYCRVMVLLERNL